MVAAGAPSAAGPTLPDEVALRALADAYAIAIDVGDADAFVATFAPGGSLLAYWGRSGSPLASFSTPSELASLVRAVDAASIATFHLVANQRCRVHGDEASVDTYCVARHLMPGHDGGRVVEVIVLHYADSCVRTDGGWRYAERRAQRLWAEVLPATSEALTVDRGIAAQLSA